MNQIKYKISTPYGDLYQLDEDGYVIKHSNGLDKTKAGKEEIKTWRITGIRELKSFNHLGMLISLSESIKIDNFLFKNGKPKYVIEDIDHGTTRIVGNSQFHGVKSVYVS